jgi:hypothetical protein
VIEAVLRACGIAQGRSFAGAFRFGRSSLGPEPVPTPGTPQLEIEYGP